MTSDGEPQRIEESSEPAVWFGALKARMKSTEFESIVRTVLSDGWLTQVHEQLLLHEGASSKLNGKFLQKSFEQNAYHQGRAPHLRALANVWRHAAFEEEPEFELTS